MSRGLERVLVAVAAAACLALAFRLAGVRMGGGELFPRASSLATTPEGTSALAEALARLPDVEVVSAVRGRDLRRCAGGCTLLYLRADPEALATGDGLPTALARLESLLERGARVVLALAPEARQSARTDEFESDETNADPPTAEPTSAEPEASESDNEPVDPSLPHWWRALEFESAAADASVEVALPAHRDASAGPEWPQTATWRSTQHLVGWPDDAAVRMRVAGNPVVVEIAVGTGRLLIVTDDSAFANFELADRRQTELVTALLGRPSLVAFDEIHLGVGHGAGVMALARGYGLTGALAALLLLAGLYVWRASQPLSPRRPAAPAAHEGLDAGSGLVALLERGLPPRQLLAACVESLRGPGGERLDEATWQALESVAAAGGDPAAGYERMRRLIMKQRGEVE